MQYDINKMFMISHVYCNIGRLLCVLLKEIRPLPGFLPELSCGQQIPDKGRAQSPFLNSPYARNPGEHQPSPPHPPKGGLAYISSMDLPRYHLSQDQQGERRYPEPYRVCWPREGPQEHMLTSLQEQEHQVK